MHTTLIGVQHLRAAAALMVVFHHVIGRAQGIYDYSVSFNTTWGAAGVDVFFVISGFIMIYITRGKDVRPLDFFIRRVIRIVPLYWIFTIIAAALINSYSFYFSGKGGWEPFIQSMLFIPGDVRRNELYATPTIPVGWTLNLEMMFYLLLSISLIWRRNYVFVASAALAVIFCLSFGLYYNEPRPGFGLYAFNNGVILEFLLGILLAYSLAQTDEIPPAVGLALTVVGVALLLFLWPIAGAQFRLFTAGLPAILIVGGFIISEPLWRRWAPWTLLGDASYAIYLTHLFAIIPISRTGSIYRDALLPWVPFWIWVALLMAISTALGVIVHLWIEKPLTRMIQRWWAPSTKARWAMEAR